MSITFLIHIPFSRIFNIADLLYFMIRKKCTKMKTYFYATIVDIFVSCRTTKLFT